MHPDVWLLWVMPEADKEAFEYIFVCYINVNIQIIAHIHFLYVVLNVECGRHSTWLVKQQYEVLKGAYDLHSGRDPCSNQASQPPALKALETGKKGIRFN